MGARVGAIPSAIGGRTIGLSHTGCVFPLDDLNLSRWRRWMAHIRRDQAVWILASILGMALPCMMSLEFIRNATVTGDRVAAMTAEGIALRYPSFAGLFWILTLLCGFLVLAPGQVSVGDQIARRWTDMIWTASPRVKRLGQGRGSLPVLWHLARLWRLGTGRALAPAGASDCQDRRRAGQCGSGSLVAPGPLRQSPAPAARSPAASSVQLGTALCGVFFLGISIAVIATL